MFRNLCSNPATPSKPPARAGRAVIPQQSVDPIARSLRIEGLSPSAIGERVPSALEDSFPRCSVKGCIFPAAGGGALCHIHDLTEREPAHFLSVQPSTLCLDRAKYGIADPGFDDSRSRDRRRLAAWRDRLRDDVA